MGKKLKTLALNRETIRQLDHDEMSQAQGAGTWLLCAAVSAMTFSLHALICCARNIDGPEPAPPAPKPKQPEIDPGELISQISQLGHFGTCVQC